MQVPQSILLITQNPVTDLLKYTDIDLSKPSVDILLISPAPSIGIDAIRDLKSFASRNPLNHTTKTIVLQDAHLATLEAQNALLKILEEPPSYLTLILTVPHTHTMLETIVSRCHIIRADTPTPKREATASVHLSDFLAVPPAKRLSLIPAETKSKAEALTFANYLISEAETQLHQHPTKATAQNLELLSQCAENVTANANPTLCVSDSLLNLKVAS